MGPDVVAAPRRIGVMGGTFDPIHHGHLVAASEVAHRFALDQVLFAPTGQPWHKAAGPWATAEERYLMTVLATSGDSRFDVTRVDVDRAGPTYTIDTLTELRAHYADPGADAGLTSAAASTWSIGTGSIGTGPMEWFFITGADALAEIASWHRTDDLVAMAHLIGVTRPGHTLNAPDLPADRWTLLEIPAMAISSTDIRRRVRLGAPIEYLVPWSVAAFIAKRGLYRDDDSPLP